MATYSGQAIEIGHLLADADMNDNQWKFVACGSAAGYFEVGTGGSGPAPIGVLQNDPRVGEPGTIRVLGTSKVGASNAIAYGDYVYCGSAGWAELVTTTGSVAMNGIALEALASGFGYIEVLLLPVTSALADNTP